MELLQFFVNDRGFSYWRLFLAAIGIIVVRHIAAIIYNLLLHPLRKFPGPFNRRISRLPWSRLHATGLQALTTQKLHDEYGSVVRIGPNHLSFTDVRAWKDIYAHRPGGEEMPKCTIYSRPVRGPPTSVLNADRDEHTRLRRALLQGFSDGSMRQQEPIISKHINLLIDRLGRESGLSEGQNRPQNIAMWYNFLTFDLTSDLVFGESFHCLETINYHPWIANIMKAIKTHSVLLALIYSGLGFVVQAISDLGALLALGKINEYTNSMLRARLSLGKGRNDLFEGLARRQDDWEKLSRNASILLLAGSETTATALAGATYYMLSNPEVYRQLKEEVRGSFNSADDININSIGRLSYLLAVINETRAFSSLINPHLVRCYPPLTSNLVRVVPTGGAEIAGHFIPEGTFVEVQPWSVNHSKDNWTDPWDFRPERFLPYEMKKAMGSRYCDDKIESSQAFSMGPRNCLGKNLAYTEMRLTLAQIIYRFDLELQDDSKGWAEGQKAFNVWDRGPLNVVLRQAMTA